MAGQNLMSLLDELEAALPDLRAAAEAGGGMDSEGGEGEMPPMDEMPPMPEEGGEGGELPPEDLETPPPFPKKKKPALPF